MTLEFKQLSDFRAAATITNGDLVYMQALADGIEQKATVRQLVNYLISVLGSQEQSIPVTADGQAIFVTEGYTAPLVNVYHNGLRLRPPQYRAMDGINIVITDPAVLSQLKLGDTLDVDLLQSMAVSGAATPQSVAALDPGNLLPIPSIKGTEQVATRQGMAMYQLTLDQLTQHALSTLAAQSKSIAVTQDGQTVFNVTYTPPLVSLFLMGWFISPTLYTATDGQTITIKDAGLASKLKAGMTLDMAGSQVLSGGNPIDPEVIDQLFPANQTPTTGLGTADLLTVSQGGNLRSSTLAQFASFVLGTLVPQRASITVQTNGQAVYTTPGYTVPLLNLYLLGRRISPNNYQATDGVTFTITNASLLANIKAGMVIDMDGQQSIAVAGAATPAQVAALDPANQTSVTTLLGTELVSMRQSSSLVSGTLNKIAQWVLSTYLGFKQTGTGTVSRTIQGKLTDYVSVKDFGAKGNGATDDTAAFLAAIASSLYVYVPSGAYVISQTLGPLPDGIHLHGCGRGNTNIVMNSPSLPVITIKSNAGRVSVTDLGIRRTGTPVSGAHGISCLGATSQSEFRNLYLTGHWIGLNLGPTDQGTVNNCISESNYNNGVMISNTSTVGAIQWNMSQVLSQFNVGWGFQINSTSTNSSIGEAWVGLTTYANTAGGMFINGGSGTGVNYLNLIGYVSSGDGQGGGILLNYAGYNNYISGGLIENVGLIPTGIGQGTAASNIGNGIAILGTSRDITICGGMKIQFSSNCGINVPGGVVLGNLQMTGLTLIENSKGGSYPGIYVAGTATRVTMTGCVSNGSVQTYGYQEGGGTVGVITGNDLTGNVTAGALLNPTTTALNNAGVNQFASGQATIASGSSQVTINHNFGVIPKTIHVSAYNSNIAGFALWYGNVTTTTFTINVSGNLTTAAVFAWDASY